MTQEEATNWSESNDPVRRDFDVVNIKNTSAETAVIESIESQVIRRRKMISPVLIGPYGGGVLHQLIAQFDLSRSTYLGEISGGNAPIPGHQPAALPLTIKPGESVMFSVFGRGIEAQSRVEFRLHVNYAVRGRHLTLTTGGQKPHELAIGPAPEYSWTASDGSTYRIVKRQ